MPHIVAASSGVFLGCVGIEIWPGADDIDGADLVVLIINWRRIDAGQDDIQSRFKNGVGGHLVSR